MKRIFLLPLVFSMIAFVCLYPLSPQAAAETAVPASEKSDSQLGDPLAANMLQTSFVQGVSIMAPVQYDAAGEASALGYDWIKMYEPQTVGFGSQNVLLRIDVTNADYLQLGLLDNRIRSTVQSYGNFMGAYEIGNETNLDREWGAPPSADHYVDVLCTAYNAIKATDPTAVVISAGLATVGRVDGSYDGHIGHNGVIQDEREYLKEFVAAGGDQCTDAIGFHPMGFSADFDAEPDVNGGTPATNCENGLCFRAVEKIHEILVEAGLDDMPIWATEVGWITAPPESCLSTPTWDGRAWQIVSKEKQEENITGAFTYAQLHWPWLQGLFIFNLNFDEAPYYDSCEQMRFYSVDGPILPEITHIFLPVLSK